MFKKYSNLKKKYLKTKRNSHTTTRKKIKNIHIYQIKKLLRKF